MPKTRRAPLPAKPQTAPRLGTRAKKDAKSLAREEDKENIGNKTTASRQHRRSGVLGATTTSGISGIATKAVPKGLRKPKPAPVKEKKLPLQDITSQFLPAPESANRGAGSEGGGEHILPLHDISFPITTMPNTSRRPNLLLSPLPPSSPPPDLVLPSVKPSEGISDDQSDGQPDNPFSDTENHRQTSSSSDPFGFAALERKLKEERRFVTNAVDAYEDDNIYEELGEILVADTSSPRPVSRIKKSVTHFEEERRSSEIENQDEAVDDIPVPLAHPHFSTPPTPHKDKNIHRRLSREGPDIFSPCSSSLESSPSPTKTSAIKRRRDLLYEQDPLEEFNTAVDEAGSADAAIDNPPSKRPCQVSRNQDDGDHNTRWNLRPRRPTGVEKTEAAPKPPKEALAAKPSRKAKPTSSKKVPTFNGDDDWEEVSFKENRV